jgi:hypothetical protein
MKLDITKPNIGDTDRLIRVAVGILLIIGAVRGDNWLSGLIGAVVIGTAYLRFCPAYTLFNFSTNKDVTPSDK